MENEDHIKILTESEISSSSELDESEKIFFSEYAKAQLFSEELEGYLANESDSDEAESSENQPLYNRTLLSNKKRLLAPKLPTKQNMRHRVWNSLQENECVINNYSHACFQNTPYLINMEVLVNMLTKTEEFQQAERVHVGRGACLFLMKVATLHAGKQLYVSATNTILGVYSHIPPQAKSNNVEDLKRAFRGNFIKNTNFEVCIEQKVVFDMVIIESVAVDLHGNRIGCGDGYNDIYLGFLMELGSILPSTIIVTLVHDLQVFDELPINMFKKYDMPVDLIVTGTRILPVDKNTSRSPGIYWKHIPEYNYFINKGLCALRNQQTNYFQSRVWQTDIDNYEDDETIPIVGRDVICELRVENGFLFDSANRPRRSYCITLSNVPANETLEGLLVKLDARKCKPHYILCSSIGIFDLYFFYKTPKATARKQIRYTMNILKKIAFSYKYCFMEELISSEETEVSSEINCEHCKNELNETLRDESNPINLLDEEQTTEENTLEESKEIFI